MLLVHTTVDKCTVVSGKYFAIVFLQMRHIYTITIGVLIQFYMFGLDIIHVILMSAVAYLMMKFMKRD